ncbi:MAG: carbon starvation CstA family protein, partial [bacterium]
MNAALAAFLALATFILAYFTYAKFIAHRIFALDPDAKTPAHTMTDGI